MPGTPSSILLIADPGVPAVIAERLSDSLPNALRALAPANGKWDVSVRRHSFPVDEHAEVLEVIRTVDPAGETEDIVIYLTDLPRRHGTTPVIVDLSMHERFGLISIPGVGGVFIDRRMRNLAQIVVAEVTCQSDQQHRSVKRLTRTQEGDVVRYVAPTALSRLQLLMGMVYANRPWRLAAGLSKVLMAAFAAGAVSLAYPTIWQLSDTMGPWRLSAATILASAAMIAWLILDHELWERPHSAGERERAVLYNAATVVTLTIGVAMLHVGLFILLLLTAWWTLPPQLVAQNIGHPFGLSSLLFMAWLVAAVATLGGALGSGMEDDEAVRAAAYGVRQRQRFDNST
ncbi:hypothetical protein BST27_23655 [Mycobacterium intermedium]|uniref:5,10-methylene-tetrahydrofolate dehydrogenase n=1 Tax=Mycobacterium intermedium TaxID=28445 RepID=A0A1E3SCW7_MYCIE|nr:hypothetical protein [Mycobacterium intermedium]MCV6964134.1 hypothetical protein [Mycobacterium intermedium]ODR00001.1 hypothetical protein BHQ20_14675 [Mycobacterium intermedium]OPE48289.1 hypothetical protein BV508_18520 [Mycobacterium intermedium]ORA96897.1 hypothetical protein BST27_23655 [Mycobacterium intermedium]